MWYCAEPFYVTKLWLRGLSLFLDVTTHFTIFQKSRLPLPSGLSVSQMWEIYMDTGKWAIRGQINDRANKVKKAAKVHWFLEVSFSKCQWSLRCSPYYYRFAQDTNSIISHFAGFLRVPVLHFLKNVIFQWNINNLPHCKVSQSRR